MPTTYPTSRQPIVTVPDQPDTATINDTVQALEDKVGITGSTDVNSLDYKTAQTGKIQGRDAMYVDNAGTPALTNNQVIYRGFGTSTNSGTVTNTVTVTLPNSGFDDATYDVFVTYLGEKATTPATRIDVTSFKTSAIASVDATLPTSATQFKASFNSNGGGNFACIAFSWVAIGTKA